MTAPARQLSDSGRAPILGPRLSGRSLEVGIFGNVSVDDCCEEIRICRTRFESLK